MEETRILFVGRVQFIVIILWPSDEPLNIINVFI